MISISRVDLLAPPFTVAPVADEDTGPGGDRWRYLPVVPLDAKQTLALEPPSLGVHFETALEPASHFEETWAVTAPDVADDIESAMSKSEFTPQAVEFAEEFVAGRRAAVCRIGHKWIPRRAEVGITWRVSAPCVAFELSGSAQLVDAATLAERLVRQIEDEDDLMMLGVL